MRALLNACGGAPVTLHRCIDVSRDLSDTYRAAAALGIDTVLTSGGAASCRQGVSQLADLLRLRDELNGPEVLIGAGVNAAVIEELRAALPGARAFHASCKALRESGMRFRREGVPMGLPGLDEWHIQQTDPPRWPPPRLRFCGKARAKIKPGTTCTGKPTPHPAARRLLPQEEAFSYRTNQKPPADFSHRQAVFHSS